MLPVRIPRFRQHVQLLDEAGRCAKRFAGAKPGGCVVILSGTPLGRSGRTNTLHLRKI